jgi:hypothetical protein
MLALMRRAALGLLFGGALAMLWGPMLRTDPHRERTIGSVVTGLLVGVLCATIRLPGPSFVGGATVGLVVGAPYALATRTVSALIGGGIIGGIIAWAANYGRRSS